MNIALSCRDLGSNCDHQIQGFSLDTIVSAMQLHAIEIHGFDSGMVKSAEMVEKMKAAVRQSSRPSGMRTSDLGM